MTRLRWVMGLLVLASHAVTHAQSPVALVKTEPLRRAALSERLVAYGVVSPDPGSVNNISVARPVRVITVRVSAGESVRGGQTLLEVATDPSAVLAYKQALSAVEFARNELGRNEQLLAQRLVTHSQVDAARKTLRDAEDALQAQERIGGGTSVQTIIAPYPGTVVALPVAPGDRVQPGQTLIQVAREQVLRVQLGVDPSESGKVKAGMPVRLESVLDPAKVAEAKVDQVQQIVNPQTQLVDVVVRLSGRSSAALLPGMRLRGLITVGTVQGWVVPRSAVLRDEGGAYVFQIKSGKAAKVSVTTGLESNGKVQIAGTFDSTLPVVVLGNYELQDAMPVREDGK